MSPKDVKILHAAIPFLHPSLRPMLTVICNIEECSHCLLMAKTHPPGIPNGEAIITDHENLMKALAPLLSPKEQELFSQLESMKEMMRMFSLYQSFAKASEERGEESGPMDFLMQMLSPEQKETMEMMKGILEEGS